MSYMTSFVKDLKGFNADIIFNHIEIESSNCIIFDEETWEFLSKRVQKLVLHRI